MYFNFLLFNHLLRTIHDLFNPAFGLFILLSARPSLDILKNKKLRKETPSAATGNYFRGAPEFPVPGLLIPGLVQLLLDSLVVPVHDTESIGHLIRSGEDRDACFLHFDDARHCELFSRHAGYDGFALVVDALQYI
jgi:hypothetical protein